MLREEANAVKDYLKEGGFLNEEMNEIIEDHVDDYETSQIMYPVKNYEDVKELIDYTVYGIVETSSEDGENTGYKFTFRSELEHGGYVFIDLLVSADGNLYISDVY